MDGYVKLYRSLNDWQWKTEPLTLAVFVHLLTNAAFKAHTWKNIELQPGQLLIGREQIAIATGVSEQSVRTALTRLKSTNSITVESTSQGSLVTVIKWAMYQHTDETSTSESTSESTARQPASNQRVTTTEERKDGKTVNKESTAEPRKRFSPPTLEEVTEFCRECGGAFDPQRFIDYYDSIGWKIGKNPMKDWKATVRGWVRREADERKPTPDNLAAEDKRARLAADTARYLRGEYESGNAIKA